MKYYWTEEVLEYTSVRRVVTQLIE